MNNGEEVHSEEQIKEFFNEQKRNSAEAIGNRYLGIIIELSKLDISKQSKAVCLLSLNVACANEIVDLFRGENTKTIETGISTIHISEMQDFNEEEVVKRLRELMGTERGEND